MKYGVFFAVDVNGVVVTMVVAVRIVSGHSMLRLLDVLVSVAFAVLFVVLNCSKLFNDAANSLARVNYVAKADSGR